MKRVTARAGQRITGICDDAKALGVHRVHLRAVLAGRRISRRLVDRYEALKAEQKGNIES